MGRILAALLACVLAWPMLVWAGQPGAGAARGELVGELALKGDVGELPRGWFVPPMVSQNGFTAALVEDDAAGVALALAGPAGGGAAQGFGNVMRTIDAVPLRGKLVRIAAEMRIRDGAGAGVPRAQMWVRVDREGQKQGYFDNMGDRPITLPEWREVEIVATIDEDAVALNVGMMLFGAGAAGGAALLRDLSLEVLDVAAAKDEAPRPLEDGGLESAVAFARAFGYVRYFYPGDEAAALEQEDWEKLAIRGVRAIESAGSAAERAEVLDELFAPIAPAVRFVADEAPALTGDLLPARPENVAEPMVISWHHHGVGLAEATRSIYQSRREQRKASEDAEAMGPRRILVKELGEGLWCVLPTSLFLDDDDRTLPRADDAAAAAWREKWLARWEIGWRPGGDDRGTRLGNIILAWNIFQHFYPYFDVIVMEEGGWEGALKHSLRSAAEDEDARAFHRTLRRLVSALHDGHGNVSHSESIGGGVLPLSFDVVENRLVVTGSELEATEGPQRGDMIVTFDRRPWREVVAEIEGLVSASTPGYRRWRVCNELAAWQSEGDEGLGGAVLMEVERADGTTATFRVARMGGVARPREARPEKISEVRPGIWYVDIGRITDQDFNEKVGELAAADGVIFDLRGYPGRLSTVVISHLIDPESKVQVTSAQWRVPQVRLPDRQEMEFSLGGWPVQPKAPRLRAAENNRVAFIIDGRAISYAETYMGIIEHYKLAHIVGETTAGTNGNINMFTLPGGYNVVFTGMKVLKHDGSQMHGVGIVPTVPVARTIGGVREGRDEFLEKAIEVVSDR